MEIIALGVLALLVWGLLSLLPKSYQCTRCDYTTPNELEALGHEKEGSLHRMI